MSTSTQRHPTMYAGMEHPKGAAPLRAYYDEEERWEYLTDGVLCSNCKALPRQFFPSGPITYCMRCRRTHERAKRAQARATYLVERERQQAPALPRAVTPAPRTPPHLTREEGRTLAKQAVRASEEREEAPSGVLEVHKLMGQALVMLEQARSTLQGGALAGVSISLDYGDGTALTMQTVRTAPTSPKE